MQFLIILVPKMLLIAMSAKTRMRFLDDLTLITLNIDPSRNVISLGYEALVI